MENARTQTPRRSLIAVGAGIGVVLLIVVALLVVKIEPDFSYLDVRILSGSQSGNYYAVVDKMVKNAAKRHGQITNVTTNGSVENLTRLGKGACADQFALVQDGLPMGDGLELVARLTTAETVFILGKEADAIRTFEAMRGMRIGIGPEGSGTEKLARQIFETRGLQGLGLVLSHHSIDEQIAALESGDLDLGLFVIEEDAQLVDDALRQKNLQIAGLAHLDAVAHHIPFLRVGSIAVGQYDPVLLLPPEAKTVLHVDTLVLGNGCASRSAHVALLTLLADTFPGLIFHNLSTPNHTGLQQPAASRTFFVNQGAGVLDNYAPWLEDLVPVANVTYIVMAVSILFNMMGAGNRFRLWRIDATRVDLETELPEIFGPAVVVAEIAELEPLEEHKNEEKIEKLTALIGRFAALGQRCRRQSVSMLVPMGQEMGYRYQESLINERIVALRSFRHRIRG